MRVTLLDLVTFLVVLILSTALHEAAHAHLADRFGDDTPRRHGRITLNPFPHLDPFMSVIVPGALYWMSNGQSFLCAAWTPVNPFAMRDRRLHPMLTALGGPAVNLGLGILATIALGVALGVGSDPAARLAILFVKINVFMGLFNLLPIPPLDGGNIVQGLLPQRLQPAFWEFRKYSFWVFLALMFTGVLGRTLFPVVHLVEEAAVGVADGIARGIRGA
jgi:Zn-dependent protease